jgi:hypothetical protein
MTWECHEFWEDFGKRKLRGAEEEEHLEMVSLMASVLPSAVQLIGVTLVTSLGWFKHPHLKNEYSASKWSMQIFLYLRPWVT